MQKDNSAQTDKTKIALSNLMQEVQFQFQTYTTIILCEMLKKKTN